MRLRNWLSLAANGANGRSIAFFRGIGYNPGITQTNPLPHIARRTTPLFSPSRWIWAAFSFFQAERGKDGESVGKDAGFSDGA
jgi:hypothetical protein